MPSKAKLMKKKNGSIIIAIANQKGGEGKTTTAVNLAFGLADAGKKSLLIDMDPQANSTGIFMGSNNLNLSMHDVFNQEMPIEKIVTQTKYSNLSLAPSNIKLAEIETSSVNVDAPYNLRDLIQNLSYFEFIVVDCPPSLSIFTINALVAATHIVIPTQAEKFSVDGMTGLQNTINSIRRRINPNLEILGALVTRLKPKTVLNKTILPVISQFFPVFKTTISEGVVVGESHLAKKSICDYAPQTRQAKEYKSFVGEILDELKN